MINNKKQEHKTRQKSKKKKIPKHIKQRRIKKGKGENKKEKEKQNKNQTYQLMRKDQRRR